MWLNILVSVIGVLSFLYVFWKKLKEDYIQNQIFTTGFYASIALIAANIISLNFFPTWWFWFSSMGILTGLTVGIIRYSLRFFEVLEAGIAGGLFVLFEFYLFRTILFHNLTTALCAGVIFTLFLIYILLNKHYKKFTWYRSGRVGFSGLMVIGTFFLIRALVAVYSPDMLSFVATYETALSGISAFVVFIVLFNLSRQTL